MAAIKVAKMAAFKELQMDAKKFKAIDDKYVADTKATGGKNSIKRA